MSVPLPSFLSFPKSWTKLVYSLLQSFIANNFIWDTFKLGFRAFHSTKSAILKVTNDLLITMLFGKSVLLIVVSLSSVFDTFNHTILLNCLVFLSAFEVATPMVELPRWSIDFFRSNLATSSPPLLPSFANYLKVPLSRQLCFLFPCFF